ncbi:TPA: hypothetical protein U2B44_002132, partial [Streptococcus suis]|nr:hypothetical protein [Streptococcus suis]
AIATDTDTDTIPVYMVGYKEATDQYNITWDNQSVAGRTDAGFEWAQDANGNKVLIYKYDLDNHTAFNMDDVLKQLNATPKDTASGLRTLDGTDKSNIENNLENFSRSGKVATLNGQPTDFLDVVTPVKLWGGRPVVSNTEGTTEDYTTFYVPNTTDIGTATNSVTVGGTNGVGTITVTDTERELYTNQVDRQKLYIRTTDASNEAGSDSAVATDTDTDTIPVYMIGYKANKPTTATNPKPLYIFKDTAIKTVDPSSNADTITTDDYVNVVTLQDPEGIKTVSVSRESDVGTAVFNPASIGITIDAAGNATGTTDKPAGVYSRGLTVTDNKDDVTNLFPRNNELVNYVFDATAGETITKAVGESVTEAEILDNVTINTGDSSNFDAAIDSRYRKVLAPGQTVPTTPGTHNVTVRVITDSNVYKDVVVEVVIPENPPATATDKQVLYLINNTPIQTVDPTTKEPNGVNKVKVATLTDPQGIQSVTIKNDKDLGYTVDTDGNASGTPKVVDKGYYSSALNVTDNANATTQVFPQSPTDQRYITHIMDVTVTGEVTKAVGQTPTEAEILEKVAVDTGNSGNIVADPTSMYEKILAPGQQVPTTPGRHEVTVRVITESNVYKDVTVTVIIPENPDTTAPESPSVVANEDGTVTVTPSQTAGDDTKTTDITYTDETGTSQTVTVTKEDDGTWSVPADSGVTVDPTTGAVT